MNNFSLIIFSILICFGNLYGDIERRAAIDIGSGGTKVSIADVDVDTNQIIDVILDTSYSVAYQAALDRSADGTFDEKTKQQGLKIFKDIKNLSDQHGVEKISAVATSAFRKANNSKEYVSEIEALTNIQVKVIPQREEGEIAFFSALATGKFNEDEAVVWDIGTGSLQITAANDNEGFTVYMGENMGSVAFKNYIIDTIQENNIKLDDSPNPISEEDLKDADSYVRAFGRKTYSSIKDKIQEGNPVIGIGRLFYIWKKS